MTFFYGSFYDSSYQKEHSETSSVRIGIFWHFDSCRRVKKSWLTCDLFWAISSKRNIWRISSCRHFVSILSKEQFLDFIRAFWYFDAHRGAGHLKQNPSPFIPASGAFANNKQIGKLSKTNLQKSRGSRIILPWAESVLCALSVSYGTQTLFSHIPKSMHITKSMRRWCNN